MRLLSKIIILLLFMSVFALDKVKAQDYLIEPGDTLSISVWGIDELQVPQILVGPDGKIAFPMVGEIQVAGMSSAEVMTNLTTALSEYVKDPKVIVNVMQYHTTRVYVLGEVTKPGMYELTKQHNLLDALGSAGSYTRDAAKKKVFIVHKDSIGKPIQVNLLKLLEQGDMSQNYVLSDGDVVYLNNNGRIDFAKDILPWVTAGYYVNNSTK